MILNSVHWRKTTLCVFSADMKPACRLTRDRIKAILVELWKWCGCPSLLAYSSVEVNVCRVVFWEFLLYLQNANLCFEAFLWPTKKTFHYGTKTQVLGRLQKTSVYCSVPCSHSLICLFLHVAESYSNPLAPDGHEVEDHRAAAQWVSIHCVCVCVLLCMCLCMCVLTIHVFSGPNSPTMTSGSCSWRLGLRLPQPRPPSPDTMSEWRRIETHLQSGQSISDQ